MPENTKKTAQTNEERINQRIEKGIQNDGIPVETAEKFLYNEQVEIPAFRFTMLQMLGSVGEGYAQCYFDILAGLEEKVKGKELPINEAGDLSQSYFRAVKRLSEEDFPEEKFQEFLSERLGETGGPPTPCELAGLCETFKEEQRQAREENRRAFLDAAHFFPEIQEGMNSIEAVLKEQRKSLEKDYGVLKDMAEEILRTQTALENSICLQTESLRETSEGISQSEKKFMEWEEAAEEWRRHAEEMFLQLKEKLESPGVPEDKEIPREPKKGVQRFFQFFQRLISRRPKRDAAGSKGKEKIKEKDGDVKGLILLLKEHGCPGSVRDKVQGALSAGVPTEEICAAVKDTYQGAGEAESKEEMLIDVLNILVLCRKQKGADVDE